MTRTTRSGEPPPVSLLSWSRGGLVIGHCRNHLTVVYRTCRRRRRCHPQSVLYSLYSVYCRRPPLRADSVSQHLELVAGPEGEGRVFLPLVGPAAPLGHLAVSAGRLRPGSALAARAAQPGSLEGCYYTACVPFLPRISTEMNPIRATGGWRTEQT